MTIDEIIKLAREAGIGQVTISALEFEDKRLTRFAALVRNAALEEAIKIIEEYHVPVGNSPAGEIACEWTLDALAEIRDAIRAMKEQPR